jgi:hypothetical protein
MCFVWTYLRRRSSFGGFDAYMSARLIASASLLCFFRLMPLTSISMTGWSSEMPFWAMMLGSIPSTLKAFLALEGDTIGVVAFEFGGAEGWKRYLRFFCRKTG